MIPTYRAKSKEQKNTYVEGLLIGVDEETKSEAGRKNNSEKESISKICNNYKTKKYKTKYQTCGGFKWKFKD